MLNETRGPIHPEPSEFSTRGFTSLIKSKAQFLPLLRRLGQEERKSSIMFPFNLISSAIEGWRGGREYLLGPGKPELEDRLPF